MKQKLGIKQKIGIIIIALIVGSLIGGGTFFALNKKQITHIKTSANKISDSQEQKTQDKRDDGCSALKDDTSHKKDADKDEEAKPAFNMSTYSVEPKDVNQYMGKNSYANGAKTVFLTFDDGPFPGVTDGILDVLKKNDVKATFFLLGKSIEASDEAKKLVKREVEEGNAIGNHSYSHDYNKLYPKEQTNVDEFIAEYDKTSSIINDVLGYDYKLRAFRMPNGYITRKHNRDKNVDTLLDKLREKGAYSIDWNSLSYDAEAGKRTPKQLVENIKKTAVNKKRLVILMHDTKQETLECLQELIDHLKSQNYQFKVFR